MMARPLMILGTSSHVGKSILTAALGRILSDDGYRVAPFKAQNMSLNSAATPDGFEIGRAQYLQAEACRAIPCAEMNPILIKPSTHTSSQVIVLGRIWGQTDASEYYRTRVEELFPIAVASYEKLAAAHEIVLLEGAGSPAEINLKARDIVNMRMALAVGAECLLVGDIDRGGVFASLLGTLELLDPAERSAIRGFVINKFRGDRSLLTPGVRMIEDKLGIPCAGVVPFLDGVGLEEEDSVTLENHSHYRPWTAHECQLRVAVIALPHLSNFTDFDALAAEPSVSLRYAKEPEQLAGAHIVILPGSKQTIDDLGWLRSMGLSAEILRWAAQCSSRKILIGICAGMQMLGEEICDPDGSETGFPARVSGLNLLPIRTVLRSEKVTWPASGELTGCLFGSLAKGISVRGYEIHLGETEYLTGSMAFASIARAGSRAPVLDGAVSQNGQVFGTYLHGLFEDDDFRHAFLAAARSHCGLQVADRWLSLSSLRQQRIDRLAKHVRQSLDMNVIYSLLQAKVIVEAV